ncbi:MAG: hypothetical protein C4589_08620 [Peptococcaceae bacterium]|nr:MAG: hypothetical protein C4589_08620 [Peptococcaceae bacterium]
MGQARWRHVSQELHAKLGTYVDQGLFIWEAARAQEIYLSSLGHRYDDFDDDFSIERYYEWFVFDFKLSSGQTVLESFQQEYHSTLSDYEKTLLREWKKAYISLYEVKSVLSGRSVTVSDLLTGKKIKLNIADPETDVTPGNILFLRVLKIGEEYEFSAGGLILPAECKVSLLRRLRESYRSFRLEKGSSSSTIECYLKEKFPKINAWVIELADDSGWGQDALSDKHKQLRNWVIIRIKDWQAVLKIIKKSNSFLLIREVSGRSGELSIGMAAWLSRNFKEGKSALLEDQSPLLKCRNTCLRQVLGHLILTQRVLILGSRSIKRLREGKRMLIAILGDLVERRPKHYRNIQGNVIETILAASTTFSLNPPHSRQFFFSKEGKGTQKVSCCKVRWQKAIKEILKVSEKLEKTRRNGNGTDRKQAAGETGDFAWPQPEYARVAGQVLAKMQEWNYSPERQEKSLKLWYDYCSQKRPSFRKEGAWIAAIIYATACLEMDGPVRQCELAREFEVAASAISANFRRLCRTLELVVFDQRYSTLKLPVELKEIVPELARSMEELYL